MRDGFVLRDVLPGFEMPPDVRVGDVPGGEGEEAEEEDEEEGAFRARSFSEWAPHRESIIAGQSHELQSRSIDAFNRGLDIGEEDYSKERLGAVGYLRHVVFARANIP